MIWMMVVAGVMIAPNSSQEYYGAKRRAEYEYKRLFGVAPTDCRVGGSFVECNGPKGKHTFTWTGSLDR